MDEFRLLVAATRYVWLPSLLASARVLPVAHDHGLDAPDAANCDQVAWWAPMEHAARLARAGVPLDLSAPGPAWLASVPRDLTGRAVWAGTLADYTAGDGPDAGWVKPAEAKVERLPAQWATRTQTVALAAAAGLPGEAWLQVCPERLVLREEHRAFIVDGDVVAMSPYLDADAASWDAAWTGRTDLDVDGAAAFARQCAARLSLPRGVVIDVARDVDRGWVLLEANPAWASNPYGADPVGVVRTILAANSLDPGWMWRPDRWLVQQAARKRPLTVCTPTWSPISS